MSERPETHVQSFAELMARLDDPFADRAAVLRAAELDEAALRRLLERWSADLERDSEGGRELARRFGDAYARAAEAIAAARRGRGAPAADPRFLNADAQAWREEAAAVALGTPAEGPPAPAAAAAPAGAPAWVPKGMRHFTTLRGTEDAVDVPRGPVIPFDPKAPPGLPKPGSPAEAGLSAVPAGMRHFSTLGSTQPAPEVVPRPALPFGPPAGSAAAKGSSSASLSLEQYASFCVELESHPAEAPRIRERYRITAAQQQELESRWRSRMAADPAVRAAWDRACAAYRAWLAGARGTKP